LNEVDRLPEGETAARRSSISQMVWITAAGWPAESVTPGAGSPAGQ
jgi:hypothetical protein